MPEIPGGWELVLILVVVVVLFGSKRLPEAARSLGKSLRILKAETKGLHEDEHEGSKGQETSHYTAAQQANGVAQPVPLPPAPTPPPAPVPPAAPVPVVNQQPVHDADRR